MIKATVIGVAIAAVTLKFGSSAMADCSLRQHFYTLVDIEVHEGKLELGEYIGNLRLKGFGYRRSCWCRNLVCSFLHVQDSLRGFKTSYRQSKPFPVCKMLP